LDASFFASEICEHRLLRATVNRCKHLTQQRKTPDDP
jgi:hypothetical protein